MAVAHSGIPIIFPLLPIRICQQLLGLPTLSEVLRAKALCPQRVFSDHHYIMDSQTERLEARIKDLEDRLEYSELKFRNLTSMLYLWVKDEANVQFTKVTQQMQNRNLSDVQLHTSLQKLSRWLAEPAKQNSLEHVK
jgi:hypothetical protein